MKGLITVTIDTFTSDSDHFEAMHILRDSLNSARERIAHNGYKTGGPDIEIRAVNAEQQDEVTMLLGKLTRWTLKKPGAEPLPKKRSFWSKLGDELREMYNED